MVLRDTQACAAGALVFELIDRAGGPWSAVIARALYIAVLTDTGGFRFTNTNPECLRMAARLVELGAAPEELYRAAYGRFHPRHFELLRGALSTLTVHEGGRIAWMTVPKEAYDAWERRWRIWRASSMCRGASPGSRSRYSSAPPPTGRIKVSLRSLPPVDVNVVAVELGGGGHVRAAAAVVKGPLEAAVKRVVMRVEEAVQADSSTER